MTVTVHFVCGGCDAEAEGTTWLKRESSPVFGNWVTYRTMEPQEVAPEGWIAFDPCTGCCYCPQCWGEIECDCKHDDAACTECGWAPEALALGESNG